MPMRGVVASWKPVSKTITGEPVTIIAYQLIIEKDVEPHRHMIGKLGLSIYVPPSVTSIAVPNGFLQPRTAYKWEVLAIEESGNQTLSSGSFRTRWRPRQDAHDPLGPGHCRRLRRPRAPGNARKGHVDVPQRRLRIGEGCVELAVAQSLAHGSDASHAASSGCVASVAEGLFRPMEVHMRLFAPAFMIVSAALLSAAVVYSGTRTGAVVKPLVRATPASAAVVPLKDAKLNIEHNARTRTPASRGSWTARVGGGSM